MNGYHETWLSLDVNRQTGEKDGKRIKEGIIFKNEENKYELYYLSSSPYGGDFELYFNDELVIKIRYHKELNEYGDTGRIIWHTSAVTLAKLSEWVEEIPKIVEIEKEKREKEKNKKEAKEIKNNFSLGKYS